MAKILFISDNFLNEGLGIMYLSANLKANGHEVFFTLLCEYKHLDDLINYVEDVDPDLVGFSVMTPQVERFRPVSRLIKERTGRTIIWGGPHCMFLFDSVTRYGCVDIICVGDGEDALLTLMDRMDANEPYTDIPSLNFKVKGDWIRNPLGPLENDMDKYPFPDRDLYYEKYSLLGNLTMKRLITSRGCPYKCAYCFQPTYTELYKGIGNSKGFRRHSVGYVMEEIKNIQKTYPLRNIHFSDDIFNLDRMWIKEFSERYAAEIGLPFTCNIEITSIDENTVRALAHAGCTGVTFGLESGVEESRINVLNKHIKDERYVLITKLLHKYNIKVMMNVIICLPDETLDAAIEGLRFALSLRTYAVRFSILKMYKGTELAKNAVANDWCEGVGEYTYKAKDTHGDFDKIRQIYWFGSFANKFPFLMTWAKPILSSRLTRLFRYLVLVNHWDDIRFFRFSLWHAWLFFWNSREQFIGGLAKGQADTFVSEDGSTRDVGDLFSAPKAVIDWGGKGMDEDYRPVDSREPSQIT